MPTVFSGQEGATIDFDEGVSITPFNLEEEMQEGHFDSEGNYFIKKEQQIRDNWLDNIDWVIKFLFIIPLLIFSLSLFLFLVCFLQPESAFECWCLCISWVCNLILVTGASYFKQCSVIKVSFFFR